MTAKGQATRARIVEAAAGLIFQNGVAATSIDDVRKAAKVSGSQMAHYFPDKRTLIRAVIEHQADSVLRAHQHPALGRLDTFEALEAWADLNLEQQRRQRFRGGCMLGSLAGQLLESDPSVRVDLVLGFERWEALLREGLVAMRERGELRPDADPAELALVLLAAAQGGVLLTQTRRDAAPLEAALGSALAYVRSFAAAPRRRKAATAAR